MKGIRRLLKTAVMIVLIWLVHSENVWAEAEPELYASSAALIDGDSGRLLYGKKADAELPMASTTKIMTCIVALERADGDLVCRVSSNASAQPKVKLGMMTGDSFYLKDLLYSLMLESHNDTAVCIAEAVAGSVEEFSALMNAKAREIGCKNTYFITPNGLDGEDENGIHHTTAYELALIMRYCLTQSPKAREFLEITQTPSYTFKNTENSRSYGCVNHNALLTILEGAVSGKTGFTAKAGYCYVGALEKDGELLIVSLLACGWPNNKGYKWVDTKKLMRYGLENFDKREIVDRNLETGQVRVVNGQQDTVETAVRWEMPEDGKNPARVQEIMMRPGEQVNVRVEMEKELEAPVAEETVLGKVTYLVDDHIYAEYPITAQNAVEKKDFRYCCRVCFGLWLL